MYHAWYSNQMDLQCGCAVYRNLEGKPTAVCLIHKNKESGEFYIELDLSHFTDWVYIGLVNEFICESRPSWREKLCRQSS